MRWILGLGILFGVLIYVCILDARHWDEFSALRECRKVAEIESSVGIGTGYTYSANGGGVATITTYIPSKTGYLCSDGITYYR